MSGETATPAGRQLPGVSESGQNQPPEHSRDGRPLPGYVNPNPATPAVRRAGAGSDTLMLTEPR